MPSMSAEASDDGYVLITAARNEAAHIANTIESVLAQEVRPRKWVIVSDGSTDDTDAVVSRYAADHPFITLIRRDRSGGHDIASQVQALEAGYAALGDIPYAYIGNLDADVTFDPDYYRKQLEWLRERPDVGITGGMVRDVVNGHVYRERSSSASIAGAVQFFRRACYEAIGGYLPLSGGMEDTTAGYMARSKGWKTEAILDLTVIHPRHTGGMAERSILRTRFDYGMQTYAIGYSALYMLAHAIYELFEPPYVTGSLFWISGYGWAFLKRNQRVVPLELVRYIHLEQHRKLWRIAWRRE